jgi:hypothetical protein
LASANIEKKTTKKKNISEDKADFFDTWEEWKAQKEKSVAQLKEKGTIVLDVVIYPKEFLEYCHKEKLEINGSARSQFVTDKMNS